MKLSIIIPTHNRADALEPTLQKLAEQKFDETWEAIVVNNNCTDDTDELVRLQQQNYPASLQLVYEKKPGAAAARNAGASAATGDYLVFIDNDILTEPDFLQRHYDALRQNPNSWIVGQFVNLPEQEKSVFGKYRKSLFPTLPVTENIRETDSITGANFSLPRLDFVRLGGFDENFHVASGEDQEFAMRGRRELGIKTLLAPGILVVHNDWAGSTFEDFCRRQQMYSQTEFYFWQKYGSEHPRLKMVEENLPADWQKDSLAIFLRKNIKQMLGRQSAQRVLINTCSLLEKSFPYRPLLWRLYKATLAGAMNHGFQQGREKFSR
jgi:glycosyltransferase involved in cell wall biosynthesis